MPKTILIVEDESALISLLSKKLEESDYLVLEAKDGEEGLKLATKEKPDLILLDIIMPKMDGISLLKKLKENKKTVDIPVIVLSNLSSGQKVIEAKETGVNDFLLKTDWTIDDIIAKVNAALKPKSSKEK